MEPLALVTNQTERLNFVLREHELRVPWRFQPLARLAFSFLDQFNQEFFGRELPPCYLRFDAEARGGLVRFHPGRNSVGARYDLNINPRRLPVTPDEFLASLLHQLIHVERESIHASAKTIWHDREFRSRAAAVGIPCGEGRPCLTLGYTEPFLAFLRRFGIDSGEEPGAFEAGAFQSEFDQAFSAAQTKPHRPKLTKYSCGCQNVWAAVDLRARCCLCGNLFSRDARPGRAVARVVRPPHREEDRGERGRDT